MKSSVRTVIAGALTLSACSMVTDVDRSKIQDDIYKVPPDAGAADAAAPRAALQALGTAPSPEIGQWGFDPATMDTAKKPGDDFNRYASGKWLDTSTIPPDRTSWNSFSGISIKTEQQVNDLIEAQPADAPKGSPSQKVHDYYGAFLDTKTIDALGLAPAQPGLARIASASSHGDIARLVGSVALGLPSPVEFGISVDQKDPDRYVTVITQGGLGLPDRDYYLKADAASVETRKAYVAHIARMLTLAGVADATAKAGSVLEVETAIAELHWTAAKRRERDLTYNPRTRAELEALAPTFPWGDFLDEAQLGKVQTFVVRELDAVAAIAKLFSDVSITTWQNYLTYHYLEVHASVLPTALDLERFDFYGRTLYGQPQPRERWKRATSSVNATLGEVVGQLYVEKHFPPAYKAEVLKLVENLRKAFGERIRKLPWMSEVTKKAALEKLSTFIPKIGYPDKWKDYSALAVVAGDAFGNVVRSRQFGWDDDLSHLDGPTDRNEWFTTPQTVNAFYNSVFNEIVFPAAILQPPFFDPAADPAVNYGAIGGVIGHEMGHGFDDQGAKSDSKGVLRTWWQAEDERAFKGLVDGLVGQYDKYEALPGLNVNGRLTVGENIGDLGGLTIAYDAYHVSLSDDDCDELDGFTGDQRFFLGWAQVWRELIREPSLRSLVLSDSHSPSVFRVNGVVRNIDAWYTAFDVKPGDALWLDPAERVRIW